MLSLSQTAGYAVLALSCLDPQGRSLSQAAAIAEATGIPAAYLPKILRQLRDAGLVAGRRGQGGGVTLARPAERITLLEIVDAVEGPGWGDRCLLGLPECSGECPCPMHEFWARERPRLVREFAGFTLDRLIAFREAGWRLPG